MVTFKHTKLLLSSSLRAKQILFALFLLLLFLPSGSSLFGQDVLILQDHNTSNNSKEQKNNPTLDENSENAGESYLDVYKQWRQFVARHH